MKRELNFLKREFLSQGEKTTLWERQETEDVILVAREFSLKSVSASSIIHGWQGLDW